MDAVSAAVTMLEKLDSVELASITDTGYPRVREMELLAHEELAVFWFGTKRNSNKVRQFRMNPKAGICFCINDDCVSLIGEAAVVEDLERKQQLWQGENCLRRFAEDVNGPIYCLLRFESRAGTVFIDGEFTELEF